MQIAKPLTSDGMASGISTFRTIWKVVEPIACAASTTPLSTSSRLPSTMRATYGNALTVSGMMMDTVPVPRPRIARVAGKSITIRMMKGTERSRLTITPIMRFSVGFGRMPSLRVMTNRTPSGRPIR